MFFVAEMRLAGPGQRLVVSARDIGNIVVPVFLVDPEFYDDFLESAEYLHDYPAANTCSELSRECNRALWYPSYRTRWRIVYAPGPFEIDVEVELISPLSAVPPLPARLPSGRTAVT
ncbi:hypothetical protein [Lacipirellula parvula]|nr:hypothetical protein [Lacipirellula parvula]